MQEKISTYVYYYCFFVPSKTKLKKHTFIKEKNFENEQ